MKISLFDMDGVLLESRGYHLALQETVRRMALALGFDEVTLSPDDIATFEAGGITSEWDEAAICSALLLETVWKEKPDHELPESLAMPEASAANMRPRPDFNALARRLSSPDLIPLHPLERAERHFFGKDHFTPAQSDILHELIRCARDPQCSLTHRTFQELVLGSLEFNHMYHLPALLNCESYLLKHDKSNLSCTESAHLRDWISEPGHAAVVVTSRPSRAPEGTFSSPEGELGAKLVGLEGIPILGWGGMCWLGNQQHADPQNYLKPSPVHALAALRMALGEQQETALTEAVELVETGQADLSWQRLEGAKVSVFEDTPGGIISLQTARKILEIVGIRVETIFFGIAQNPVKITALQAVGARILRSSAFIFPFTN